MKKQPKNAAQPAIKPEGVPGKVILNTPKTKVTSKAGPELAGKV